VEPTIVATQGSMITNIKHCANQPTLSTMEYNVEKLAATDYTCIWCYYYDDSDTNQDRLVHFTIA